MAIHIALLALSIGLASQDAGQPNVASAPEVNVPNSNTATEHPSQSGGILELTCSGGGNALKSNLSSASVYGSNGESASAWGTSTRSQGFEGQVDLKIFTGDDRIRLPRIMLPPAHGGQNGWFKIRELSVTDREITGRAAINFVNAPRFRVDRTTGAFEISGMNGAFSGKCRKIEPEKDKALF